MSEKDQKRFRRKLDGIYGKHRETASRGRAQFLAGNQVKGVHDEHLVHREVYNPGKHAIVFERQDTYEILLARATAHIPHGEKHIVAKPDGFAYLPHGYYVASIVDAPPGEIGSFVTNFGDSMFIGNKKVSLPILK
jgi:hypothetical protein